MRALAIVCAAGCWNAHPAPPAQVDEQPPQVQLAVASGHDVKVVALTGGTLVVTRTAKAPSRVDAMEWVGDDPVVILKAQVYDESGDDEKLDGTIGRITVHGFVAFPALPQATWSALESHAGNDMYFEVSRWNMVVTATGEVWQGFCGWAMTVDMQPCDDWLWARIDAPGGPAVKEPPASAPAYPLPKIAPPAAPQLSFVPFKVDEDREPVKRLRCVENGRPFEYPPANDVEFGMSPRSLVWISREPPLYQVVHGRGGFAGIEETVVFEGCHVSAEFQNSELVGGPEDMLALTGGSLAVLWRGREVGRLATDASIVRFARPRK